MLSMIQEYQISYHEFSSSFLLCATYCMIILRSRIQLQILAVSRSWQRGVIRLLQQGSVRNNDRKTNDSITFRVISSDAIGEKGNREARWKRTNSGTDMMCRKVCDDQDMNSIELKCNFTWVLRHFEPRALTTLHTSRGIIVALVKASSKLPK